MVDPWKNARSGKLGSRSSARTRRSETHPQKTTANNTDTSADSSPAGNAARSHQSITDTPQAATMTDSTPTSSEFAALDLPAEQIDNLRTMGYTAMTAIQQLALPLALDGKDLIAQAKTGSGKTASFAIPLLTKINPRFFGVQGLIMCPTRELASQVATEIRQLARYLANIKVVVLSGGVSIGPQIGSLEHGAHIVVGTPGRLKDHLRKNTLDISQVHTLVLDEADRMLDMGFSDDIQHIIGHTPEDRQTLLFSATYPNNIQKLSAQYQQSPEIIKVESTHTSNSIDQRLVLCDRHQRPAALERVLAHFDIQQAVVFCNTKQSTEEVAQQLKSLGFIARAINGDLEQRDRDAILTQFKQGSANFLVATDVAARGLDVDDLPAVINVEVPRELEVYTHRIGRTGRAGKEGIAITLIGDSEDNKRKALNNQQGIDIPCMAVEELSIDTPIPVLPEFATLCIAAGRKHKMRPGDVLGALTAPGGIQGKQVGKIHVLDMVSYVAVERTAARQAVEVLNQGRVKGKTIKARKL
ncbi:ATP-dependent RNA helicase DbpA [Oceanobacter sp. 4_MG-2023]|uniref:ATP-dependent RNA helicase DbpA n=2 Tax=Gammaproteobacteria TaxID=1236 RepID=UPI00351DC536